MVDENNKKLAEQVYQTLCSAIENRNWSFEKNEEKLMVNFDVTGEDLPMRVILIVDAERQLIRLLSPLPFRMSESKRMEGAIATCSATYDMVDGSFDYDLSNGTIMFRMTASFIESVIGEGLFQYMISCACSTVDKFNDLFLALDKGIISVTDFISKI